MITEKMAVVQSDEELAKLADGKISLQAKYSFQNPYSINGPFGTLNVTLMEEPTGQSAIGTVTIQTLFGMGSETILHYNGAADFNGSSGYTSVKTIGKGTMHAWPNPPKPVTTGIQFALAPGFKSGTLTVDGFFQGFELTAISIQITG